MDLSEVEFLREGYKEIIEIVDTHVETGELVYSPEEIIEKIIEISEIRLMGEL